VTNIDSRFVTSLSAWHRVNVSPWATANLNHTP
jgi:hypothetical protein